MNQQHKVIQHLRAVGNISGMEASDLYRIRDLPKRVSSILHEPQMYLRPSETIVKQWKEDRLGQRYMRYALSPSSAVHAGA